MNPRRAERYDTTEAALDVLMHEHEAGVLGEHEDDVWYRYRDGYAQAAMSVRLPVRALTYGHRECRGTRAAGVAGLCRRPRRRVARSFSANVRCRHRCASESRSAPR